jgi:hypothetical protein
MFSRRIVKSRLAAALAVTALAAIAWAVLSDARERLEQAQVEATVRNLNSALQFEIAHRLASGREAMIGELAGINPVSLAAQPPGYAGEADGLPADIQPGQWLFDRARGELVYRPLSTCHLRGAGTPPLLRWRVERTLKPHGPAFAGGLALVAVVEYRWN